MKKFFIEMLSELGADGKMHASSKRVMGAITLVIALVCMVYLTYIDRGTTVVENLLQTSMIMAASLLGISSITGIWKGNSVKIDDPKSTGPETPTVKEPKHIKCPYLENA